MSWSLGSTGGAGRTWSFGKAETGKAETRPAHALAALCLLVAVGAALLLGGCGSQSSLDGTSWRLTWWADDTPDPSGWTIIATFKEGRVGGTAAVNTYGAAYEASSDGDLALGPIAVTEMAGPVPDMNAEAVYLRLLQRVRAYRLDGEQLTLLDGEGRQLLVFDPAQE